MAPSRRKEKAAAAAAARRQWKVGDLVLAKVKGFPAWPASVGEPGRLGYSTDGKKILVHFYGTQQIAFCNPADIEAFTEEKKQTLLTKRHGKGSDFVRAVREITEKFEEQQTHKDADVQTLLADGGNSTNSTPNLGLKDQLKAPEATINCQLNSSHSIADGNGESCPVEDSSATGLVDAVGRKEEPTDTAMVSEPPLSTAYSLTKITRDLLFQNGVSRGKESIVRKSRSSSRLESRRLQDSVAQSSDTGINCGAVSASVVSDGLFRRNTSKRNSFEASERGDTDLSVFTSSGSIEDVSSEVVTVEFHNDVSTTDSDCKIEHSETVVGCSVSNLNMEAVVTKKKRKPNRKRPPIDAVEPSASVDKKVSFPNTTKSSRIVFEEMSVSSHKDDGDEHLPLVKRARVRMSESALKEPIISPSNAEENIQKEPVSTSAETIKSPNCNPPMSMETFRMNAASFASASGGGPQFHGSKTNLWMAKKDDEAALPPSKRLHRALEAMSANAAEEQSCSDVPSDMNILTNGTLSSSTDESPCVAIERRSPIEDSVIPCVSDAHCMDALEHGTSSNPDPTLETDLNSQRVESSNIQNDEPGKEFILDAGHQVDKDIACDGSNGGVIIPSVVASLSPRHLSGLRGEVSDVRAADGSEELPLKDKGNAEQIELVNLSSEETGKQVDACEGIEMSTDSMLCVPVDVVVVTPKTDAAALQLNTEITCFANSSDDNREENDMCEVVTEEAVDKQMLKEPSFESFPNGYSGDGLGVHSSPCLTDGGNSLAQASPFNASSGRVSTSDHSSFIQNNGSCSPDVHLCHKTSLHPRFVDEERKLESLMSQRPKSVDKYRESNSALSSFEALLGTLTRTKESIARATRLAMDCARFGATSKVVDVLTHFLETESSLPRRVDLFFLVDSIVKGDVGGLYTSSIQAMLPRLVAAAAPTGSSGHENRRQCLKVLRLWLEKKILSESVIRRHMRELDSYGCPAAGAFSRRSSRTERSLDDPLREMEGMLVDEYGSNSSFQLPGFCMPSMLKDEDAGSDSDGGSFEAVTPEHSPDNHQEPARIPVAMEKHRHILEDVDGELEMEDVAPTCETELTSSSGGIGMSSIQVSENPFEHHPSQQFAPPLPQDVPPSSPPLPSSPPPCTRPHHMAPDTYPHGMDSKLYSEHMQDNMSQQCNTSRMNQPMSDAVRYHASDHRDLQRQMPESFPGRSFHNKNYPSLRPPYPPPSNQFSFFRGEPHFKPRQEGAPPPSDSHRYQMEQNWDRENYYNNHERMKMAPHEPDDGWRYPPHSFSGSRYPGKGKFYGPDQYGGPPSEHVRYPDHGWRHPPRNNMSHRNSMPFRPHHEGPIPVSNRDPNYWRPR